MRIVDDARRCGVCEGAIVPFVDLGEQPSANAFLDPEDLPDERFLHLQLGLCTTCSMAQLVRTTRPEDRYCRGYAYHASTSTVNQAHFTANALRLVAEDASADPFVVEIGSNDGVMLEAVARAGVRHLGVDPSETMCDLAAARGVDAVARFFDENVASDIRAEHGPASVVFGANAVCHVDDLGSLMRGVDKLLADDGVFEIEDPYLRTIVDGGAFDQVYDEHVYYFTATSVANMAERHGLELVDATPIPQHGGQIRYRLARPGAHARSEAVAATIAAEHADGLDDVTRLAAFGRHVDQVRRDLRELLDRLRAQGATVVGYGAAAKCSTATNALGITGDDLPFVSDSTPAKQGHLVPGSHIPVVPPEVFAESGADYALLFSWNHAEEILAKEAAFAARGGRWIRYVPRVEVL